MGTTKKPAGNKPAAKKPAPRRDRKAAPAAKPRVRRPKALPPAPDSALAEAHKPAVVLDPVSADRYVRVVVDGPGSLSTVRLETSSDPNFNAPMPTFTQRWAVPIVIVAIMIAIGLCLAARAAL